MKYLILTITVIINVLMLVAFNEQLTPIVFPCVIILDAYALFIYSISTISPFPLFNFCTLCVTSTFLYCIIPLLGFLLSNNVLSNQSDDRLINLAPTPEDIGNFSWRHVAYFVSLVLGSLSIRWKPEISDEVIISTAAYYKSVFFIISMYLYFIVLLIAFNASYAMSYDDPSSTSYRNIPYLLQQISQNFFGMQIIVKQFLAFYFILHWDNVKYRTIFYIWMAWEVLSCLTQLGARTTVVVLLISSVLLFHRFVRPMSFAKIFSLGVLFVFSFIAFGIFRDMGNDASLLKYNIWSSRNEFQSMFATSYDLFTLKNGLHPPWYVYLSEFFQLIPSQLLPFQKMDLSEWYLDIKGIRNSGVGYMFGVISQGVIGYDFLELILRGFALGILGCALHNWYARHANIPAVILIYLFCCAWCYDTFRDSTFSLVYFFIYRLIPVIVILGIFHFRDKSVKSSLKNTGFNG